MKAIPALFFSIVEIKGIKKRKSQRKLEVKTLAATEAL